MLISIQSTDIEIQLHPRESASEISATQWDTLSRLSLYQNPFYERWNLIPALKHLDKNVRIYLALIIKGNELIGLFPVSISKFRFGSRCLNLWMHDHCYFSDPLMSEHYDINSTLCNIGEKLKTQIASISLHNPKLFNGKKQHNIFTSTSCRAAILNPNRIISHLDSLPAKVKRDLKRTKKNLIRNLNISVNQHNNLTEGFNRFRNLEHKGWKGLKKGSINCNKNTINYYTEIMSNDNCKEIIQFHELIANNTCIASCIRFKSNRYYFEVKTSYDESYKCFNPGKLLEIEILNRLTKDDFILVDSCTSEDNHLINQLWPDKVQFNSSYIFFPSR
jgi:CelD/BcsL family acetyltransferase involved in cellulose biosynthesis